jgi:rhodanese-related sulfurtransferase
MSIKKIFLLMMISSVLLNNTACGQKKVQSGTYNIMLKTLLKNDVPIISAKEAHQKKDDFAFLDSREKPEFEVSHIKNAVWVGYDDFNINRLKGISKNQKIVVYCSVGARSEKITEKLMNAGYTNIQNMYGGVFEWINDDFPVYDMQGKQTTKVHAYSKAWGIWLKKGDKVYQ